jgi:hypothetical protein
MLSVVVIVLLKALFDRGLISQSEYDAKRKQILQSF